VIGILLGLGYGFQTSMGPLPYPNKYSGDYGLNQPCEQDEFYLRTNEIMLVDFYSVGKKSCGIQFVEKNDGYYEFYPTKCSEDISTSTSIESKSTEVFNFAFKPIDQYKISVRIDNGADQVYTKCHLLREDNSQ